MSRKKGKKRFIKLSQVNEKRKGEILSPFLISVNLQSTTTKEESFLGFRLIKGRTNQLWDWNTLQDVNF